MWKIFERHNWQIFNRHLQKIKHLTKISSIKVHTEW
jgi:hypothetical protein